MPSITQMLAPVTGEGALSLPEEGRARLERMFNEQHDFIWRLLRRLGVSSAKADDATQHVFLIAAERLPDIKMGSERAFLFGTALRVARTFLRRERRWVLEHDMDMRLSEAPRTEDVVEVRRTVDLMDRILSSMDIDLRTTFILFELEGLTVPEIASLIGVPVGTAASRLRRARLSFRSRVASLEKSLKGEASS